MADWQQIGDLAPWIAIGASALAIVAGLLVVSWTRAMRRDLIAAVRRTSPTVHAERAMLSDRRSHAGALVLIALLAVTFAASGLGLLAASQGAGGAGGDAAVPPDPGLPPGPGGGVAAGPEAPLVLSNQQSAGLTRALRRIHPAPNFVIGLYAECGDAQNFAFELAQAIRAAPLTVYYSPGNCRPLRHVGRRVAVLAAPDPRTSPTAGRIVRALRNAGILDADAMPTAEGLPQPIAILVRNRTD